jgi:DDE superfamily endonuclease
MVLSVDEKTSVPPRCRVHPMPPAPPGNIPPRHEHEDTRGSALHVFAAVDIRSGQVVGQGSPRKRQQACMTFLEQLDREMAQQIKTIHLVCDHVSTHHGQAVRKWVAKHARCLSLHARARLLYEAGGTVVQHHPTQPPAHRRLCLDGAPPRPASPVIGEWNQHAHPFHWSTTSVAKVMAKAPAIGA